jgi:hypothetical protein
LPTEIRAPKKITTARTERAKSTSSMGNSFLEMD